MKRQTVITIVRVRVLKKLTNVFHDCAGVILKFDLQKYVGTNTICNKIESKDSIMIIHKSRNKSVKVPVSLEGNVSL